VTLTNYHNPLESYYHEASPQQNSEAKTTSAKGMDEITKI